MGGLALASLPPFGPFLGKAMIEEAGSEVGYGWIAIVFVVASALTGGAVLRAAGRVFFGWGRDDEEHEDFPILGEEADPELDHPREDIPLTLTATMVVLIVGGLALGLVPGIASDAVGAAARFIDRSSYAAAVLGGGASPGAIVPVPTPSAAVPTPGLRDWLLAFLTVFSALGLAAHRALPRAFAGPVAGRFGARFARRPVRPPHAAQRPRRRLRDVARRRHGRPRRRLGREPHVAPRPLAGAQDPLGAAQSLSRARNTLSAAPGAPLAGRQCKIGCRKSCPNSARSRAKFVPFVARNSARCEFRPTPNVV